MKSIKMTKAALRLLSIITLTSISANSVANEWTYQLEPYAMATNIEGDAGVGCVTGADINFDTILDNLEMAALVHFDVSLCSKLPLWSQRSTSA